MSEERPLLDDSSTLLELIDRLDTLRGTKWQQMPVGDWIRLRDLVRRLEEDYRHVMEGGWRDF